MLKRNISGNQLRTRWRSKGAWAAFFWSYIVLLLLLIIIGSLLYWRAKIAVEKSVDQTNVAILGQLRELADGQLEKIEQLEQQIVTYPKLLQLLSENPSMSSQQNYNMLALSSEYERYRNISPLVYDFYIYLPGNHTVLGPGVRTTPAILFDQVYRFEGKSAQDWLAYFDHQTTYQEFQPEVNVTNNLNESIDIVPYTQSLSLVSHSKQKASLFIMISANELRKLFQGLTLEGKGNIYILDRDNRMICSTDERHIPLPIRYEDLTADHGKLEMDWEGENTVFSYATSTIYEWKYVLEVPRSIFLQEVYMVRQWAIALLILAALAGAAVSCFLTYRNYLPIRHLVHTITGANPPLRHKRELNEYELIMSTIETSRLTESELRSRLLQQAPIIRFNFLSRLIRGYAEPHELRPESLQFMGIHFVSSSYAVILINVEDMSNFTKEGNEREWMFVSFIISNIAEDLANEHHAGYSTELDQGRIALLLNLQEEPPHGATRADLDLISDKLQYVLQHSFRLKVSISSSFIVQNVQTIGEAFRDALKRQGEGRERNKGPGGGMNAALQNMPVYYYPMEIEQQLTNFVKSGDEEKTSQLLDALYADHFTGEAIPPSVGFYFIVHVASTLFRIVQQTPHADPLIASRLLDRDSPETRDPVQAFSRIKLDFLAVCRLWKEGRSDQSTRMLETVKRIVQQGYCQNGLSVGMIADELGITQPYLSSFFKKATGQTIMEYIASFRLEEAKRILSTSDLTIGQVAKLVGYTNDIGFIRFFKKYEGITPGQFRENLHAEHRS
ncbi:MAG: AraC family transcriptional regulator [Gorillibacterium sp.]|nr:AraC family transcriptional regulator [Gorillibacterium sp.]